MTIIEVAKIAGVSIATVSRVINGGRVSNRNREKVRKIIDKYEYFPNSFAQHLARRNRSTRRKSVNAYDKMEIPA